ncbi:MAG: TonB-dependent receptor, partial [Rhodocyclaceae bacterium]
RVADRRLGVTRDARDLPRYQLTLAYEQSLPFWASSAGLNVQHYGPLRTAIAGELQAGTARRTVLDAHWVRRLSGSVNLRLQAENLLRADLRRNAGAWSSAVAGTDAWTLDTVERGQRTWLLSLEGKW